MVQKLWKSKEREISHEDVGDGEGYIFSLFQNDSMDVEEEENRLEKKGRKLNTEIPQNIKGQRQTCIFQLF